MDRGVALVLTAAVGGMIALQAPINSGLGKRIGSLPGATFSFAVGTILLIVLTLLVGGGFGRVPEARHLPWQYLLGGVLGAGYVTCALITVSILGAGGATAATITGQLTMAVIIDQFGLLGISRHPISVLRLVGIVLLAAGTFLVVRE